MKRWLLRAEDVLLAIWIAVAAPLLVTSGNVGLFDTGKPFEGVAILASVGAALYVLVTRPAASTVESQTNATGEQPPTDVDAQAGGVVPTPAQMGAFVGPLTGGMLLVAVTGFSALSAPDSWNLPILVAGLVVVGIVRFAVPSVPVIARRALVTPFVLVSGSLFWSVIDAVIGPGRASGVTASDLRDALLNNVPGAGGVGLALLAFTAVYYAMLVYAPRQVAESEGGPIAWLVRFGLFVVSMLFGVGWINAFGL